MKRSNHFTDEDIDRGRFPDHISRDGKAYFKGNEGTDLATPSVGTLRAAQGDGQRCRYCEGDIDTGWVTLCSFHAAAPAMYEVLKDARNSIDGDVDYFDLRDRIDAALAVVADNKK